MSIKARRIVVTICIAAPALVLVADAAMTAAGHYLSILGCLFPAAPILSGFLFLRSTRGRS
jgi:hypothetical protein